MSAPVSRRALLGAASLAVASRVLPGAAACAVAKVPTSVLASVMALDVEWGAWMTEAEAFTSDEACDARIPERWRIGRIEAALRDAVPTDLRDLAARVLVLSGEGDGGLPDPPTLECASIVGRDFAKLPRGLFENEAA